MELEKSPFGKHHCNHSSKKNQWVIKLEDEKGMRNGVLHRLEVSP